MKYTSFNIFKNNKKTDAKHPDYTMQVSEKQADGKYKNFDVAGIWLKDMASGGKFMSGMMKKTYQDKAGFTIQEDKPEVTEFEDYFSTSPSNPPENFDPNNIAF